ncbi:CehA/McbA family metallohydrolase [Actinacidiphila glaucinigra]|uniref:Predicted metal-dependent phosphoesterase TrpH, contains PHP domain n=1 Tax=Actinacidiphila glaucinigra TaxID=235986 RepID=A0A239MU88_9ACTN|nr:CehA/McbA family metallohydrolase [Actinacidiphila glaucinigra]SNT46367.1 Predicted metal-dependent phosphoesterase TrpH, contains PHP domain [Actinacidiphila glaucinigra]
MSGHHADTAHTHAHGPSRRSLLAGAGGLLIAASLPGTALAAGTRTAADTPATNRAGASRASLVTQGTRLVHADLHNHTLMSDGDGDPALAFASMRDAGLDVAALTDHTTLLSINGLSKGEWDRTRQLADAANDPGNYTAIRGFEWSHPLLGHANVWFTDQFVDLGGASSMGSLYNWIAGRDAVAGFNHPGREIGRFNDFAYSAAVRDKMVSVEMFNRGDDYLFDGWSDRKSSHLNAVLNAGWRTGITGVSDHHGAEWGKVEGVGRAGLWVTENTRAGVLEAMRARRFFATRFSGLRLDATAGGVQMGGVLPLASGDVRFAVDLDRGPDWLGKPLDIQVLRPGSGAPTVAEVVPTTSGGLAEFTVPLDVEDGAWVVLRISDPSQPNGQPGPSGHPCNDLGVAYSSPWWLQP